MKKYLKVMLVLVVVLSVLSTFAFAAAPFADIKAAMEDTSNNASTIGNTVNTLGAKVINIIQTIGYVVAVVMILVVGIQWLMGTPAKKQELKGKMWNIAIGAILIIAGVSLLGLVAGAADEVEKAIPETSSTTLKA